MSNNYSFPISNSMPQTNPSYSSHPLYVPVVNLMNPSQSGNLIRGLSSLNFNPSQIHFQPSSQIFNGSQTSPFQSYSSHPSYPMNNSSIQANQEKKTELQNRIYLKEGDVKEKELLLKISQKQLQVMRAELQLLENPHNSSAKSSLTKATNSLNKLQNPTKQNVQKQLSSEEINQKLNKLWIDLQSHQYPQANLDSLSYPGDHRFTDVPCPLSTSIIRNNHSLHANIVTSSGNPQHPIKTGLNLVASQAPLKKNENLFWEWIFNCNYYIFDLTSPKDELRGYTPYYPTQKGEKYRVGPFTIELIEEEGIKKTYKVLYNLTNQSKIIERVHCDNWEDFSTASLNILDDLVQRMTGQNNSFWVHCLAGIGRSGTLIASALLHERIRDGNVSKEDLFDIIPDIVRKIRYERGSGCVQTTEQFRMIYDYGIFLINNKSSK